MRSAKPNRATAEVFPIVGVGASAGGLDAFERLLRRLPEKSGMAFVLVQHLDPRHESRLEEILSRATMMPVTQVRDGTRVVPNHVYVIPPNRNMLMQDGALRLQPRTEPAGPHLPIDFFFRSLALSQKNRAIGVILSGTASDGAGGARAIKAEGGITFAQDAGSAKYHGMPHAAISAGAIDFVLSPEDIAKYLTRIGRHPYIRLVPALEPQETLEAPRSLDGDLVQLFSLLKKSFGVDFSAYKLSTIERRIKRRMALAATNTLKDYVAHVRANPIELQGLFQDMFIGVTSFFREPSFFDALAKTVLPKILKRRSGDTPVRIWVPGCSTGEEVYSLAITLQSHLRDKAVVPVQIFGTDINEEAIRRARQGKFPESIAGDVGTARLRQYFVKTEEGYQASKAVRDMCIFAQHDLLRDPPFSRLDLLSCRNVLIYLGARAHQKLLPLFHYALKPTGYLALGSAESVGGFADLFSQVDRKQKIYAKKPALARPYFEPMPDYTLARAPMKPLHARPQNTIDAARESSDRIILNHYAPPSVLVNENMEIVHFRGQTGHFLEPASGAASLNLLKMARPGLRPALQTAIQKASRKRGAARVDNVRVEFDGMGRVVNVHAVPLTGHHNKERSFLVLFEETRPLAHAASARHSAKRARQESAAEDRARRLQQELISTTAYLESVIESGEASNEELRSLNEEILSANEELHSTTEELETANEELKSANEELTTLNEELQNRNAELHLANNDIHNLLTAMNVSVVIVDRGLRIRRFTSLAQKTLGLIPSDIGRPITEIHLPIDIADLDRFLTQTIDTTSPRSQDVRGRDGRYFSLMARPYITTDSKIDGAILVLVDIHELTLKSNDLRAANVLLGERLVAQEQAEAATRASEERFESIANALPELIGHFDNTERYAFNNLAYEKWTGLRPAQLLNMTVKDVIGSAAYRALRPCIEKALHGERAKYLGTIEYPQGGVRFVQVDYMPHKNEKGKVVGCSELVTDLTEVHRVTILEERSRLARDVHDTLAQNFVGITLHLDAAIQGISSEDGELFHHIERAQKLAQAGISEARSTIRSLHPEAGLDLHRAIELFAKELAAEAGFAYSVTVTGTPVKLPPALRESLFRIAQEALQNVSKHAKARKVEVEAVYFDHGVRLIVRDDGQGFSTRTHLKKSAGHGLAFMSERAKLAGAKLKITSNPGNGTTVEITASPVAENQEKP